MMHSRDNCFLCKPLLARGCHLRDKDASAVILIPEGLIRLNESALRLIRLCDGQRTLAMIIIALQAEHAEHPAERIEADIKKFILRLAERKVLVLL